MWIKVQSVHVVKLVDSCSHLAGVNFSRFEAMPHFVDYFVVCGIHSGILDKDSVSGE